MQRDTQEGQTHYQNDGCGEPEHNDKPKETKLQELERRIRDLENKSIQPTPYSPIQPNILQVNRCTLCGTPWINNHSCTCSTDWH